MADLLKSQLDDTCYPDPYLKTLTIDICVYMHQKSMEDETEVVDGEYTPGITTETWKELLNEPEIFRKESLEVMKRMLDIGGEASCKQLSQKYGKSVMFYNVHSTTLAIRVFKKTQCPLEKDEQGNNVSWPVLYKGRPAEDDETGT